MAKFTLKKAVVKVTEDEGNSFEVRGLSPNDIAQLLMLHKPVMDQLFERFVAREADSLSADEIAASAVEIATGMLEQAPPLVAHILALAADDTESYEDYARLPTGIQLEALMDIGRLTFETAGGSKKLLDLVKNLMRAKAGSAQIPSPSMTGSGASVAR